MKRFLVIMMLFSLVLSSPLFAGGSREPATEDAEVETQAPEQQATEPGSTENGIVEDGKMVQIHYRGTLADGSVFDSSEGRDPLEFMFGVGMVIPGLEEGLRGMRASETADIEVGYMDAYGPYREEGRIEYPREQIDPGIPLEEGMMLQGQGPQGPIPVTVLEVYDDTVLLDFNHPYAGEDLFFHVEVISVREASEEEMEMIFGGGFPMDE